MVTSDWGSADLGGTIGTLHAGGALRLAHWPAPPGGPGTVILVQGYGEFMELYGEAIGSFRKRGYAVAAFDFRGQGGSARRVTGATHLARFRDHVDDLVAVVRHCREAGLPRPFFIAAHSMGGLVALKAADEIRADVARMVLFAPLLQVARLPLPEQFSLLGATLLSGIGLARRRVAKSVTGPRDPMTNRLTTDPDRYQAMCTLIDDNPALVSGPPTFGWVRCVLSTAASLRANAETPLAIPTLMLAAGRDSVVSTLATDRFARTAPGGGLVILPDARHQLFLERDEIRNAAFAAFDAFVASAIEDAQTGTTEAPAERPRAKQRPLRFTATRTAPPVTVAPPLATPDPAAVAPLSHAAIEPETGAPQSAPVREAPERPANEPAVGDDDALFRARRRTRVLRLTDTETPREAGAQPAQNSSAADTPATPDPLPAAQPAPAASVAATDSIDALLRTRRRRIMSADGSARVPDAHAALASPPADEPERRSGPRRRRLKRG